jgi:hypothetical protein
MFSRPATPSAAGTTPGLLRRAFSALRAAVDAVRPKAKRVRKPASAHRSVAAPPAPALRLRLEATGQAPGSGAVTASWDGQPLRCSVVLGTIPREHVPKTAAAGEVVAPRCSLPGARATCRWAGASYMKTRLGHAVGRVQVRLLAFRERGLLAPAPDLLLPPTSGAIPLAKRYSLRRDPPAAQAMSIWADPTVCNPRPKRASSSRPSSRPLPHHRPRRPGTRLARPAQPQPYRQRACPAARASPRPQRSMRLHGG